MEVKMLYKILIIVVRAAIIVSLILNPIFLICLLINKLDFKKTMENLFFTFKE
jgi:hypothetical protein